MCTKAVGRTDAAKVVPMTAKPVKISDILLQYGYVLAQVQLGALYRDPSAWSQKTTLNVAGSKNFSSDRTIHEYATEIWKAEPCPTP